MSNEKNKNAELSKAQLLADGWVETNDEAVILEKPIENRNPINSTPEDTDIKLIVHCYFNSWQFAVLFPDGGMLNFVANSMEELTNFEKAINFYDCPY